MVSMKIEKLNEDKIRITLNLEDLKEKDIDFHAFMSNSIESQDLFLDMLDEAEKEVGFVTDDYKIMIEALAMADGNFVLTVTRIAPEKEKNGTYKRRKVGIKRKSALPENAKKAIYRFPCFEDFCAYCNYFKNNMPNYSDFLVKDSCLYSYHSNYYLVFTNITMNVNLLKSFCSGITEFANFMNHSELFESKLKEYGELIMKENAISTGIEHFC